MKIKTKDYEIECELPEAIEVLKEINGKGKVNTVRSYIRKKTKRTCVVCGTALTGRKTRVCGNPECKRKVHNKYCLNYLKKRKKNGGVPLNATAVPVFVS